MAVHPWRNNQTTQAARLSHAATARGVSMEAYAEHLQNGEAWCGYHKGWEPRETFYVKNSNKLTGVTNACKEGVNAQAGARAAAKKASV